MAYHASGPGVSRDHFFSNDPAEIERFLCSRFSDVVELRPVGGVDVECGYETLAAGTFAVGHTWTTLPTTWAVGDMQETLVIQHLRHGEMLHAGPVFGEVRARTGETVVVPPVGEFRDSAEAFDIDLVALDTAQVARFAEYAYGVAEADVRVTGLAPVTASGQRRWDGTAARVRDEVLGNPVLADSAIVLDRAFRCLVTSFLSTFPNTAYATVSGGRRPRRRVSGAALREVRGYLRAYAGEPVGPADLATVGGAPAADVVEAMVRRHDVHPGRVLWEARLTGARRSLYEADPVTGDVAATAARWGFTRLDGFRVAYAHAFGESPEATLRR